MNLWKYFTIPAERLWSQVIILTGERLKPDDVNTVID
jgi:hypothetical protein